MVELENELKRMIVDTLNLEDISIEEIDSEAPLFGDGLGLDSIDALELGVAMQNNYGIKLNSESEETKKHFASVRNLALLVQQSREK
ncbi:phosphopantetheine-binding protein [Porticoccus sp. W117]|uniref:phosphopantetheine-binding protein n=1 Tax=Porticoccus sp. W117 TaxID=3054777 RepID=UPI002591EE22|nr:phosphopantetheine-binding protein [Porticoccus sp. W117]MDM3869858.1 phosphopantetheine-binding protein [Porticoccus sp. W117]